MIAQIRQKATTPALGAIGMFTSPSENARMKKSSPARPLTTEIIKPSIIRI